METSLCNHHILWSSQPNMRTDKVMMTFIDAELTRKLSDDESDERMFCTKKLNETSTIERIQRLMTFDDHCE